MIELSSHSVQNKPICGIAQQSFVSVASFIGSVACAQNFKIERQPDQVHRAGLLQSRLTLAQD